MDQNDTIIDQVSEIEELKLTTEVQTSKILELEQEIKQILENKDFFEKAKKDLDDSINPKTFKSPQSSEYGAVTERSQMDNLENDFEFLKNEFMALGINSATRKHEDDPSPISSNNSGESKASHLTNRNQYCIKNKIEGERVVSDEILNTPTKTSDLEVVLPQGIETAKNSPKPKNSLKIAGFEKSVLT